jgi:SUF system feS assembly protein, nifU family
MPISINQEMMREIIMDHYSNPRNFREEKDPTYKTVYMDSTSCIDKIYVQAKIENNILVDVCWHGIGCAISKASTSIMSELLKGKTIEQANEIIKNYLAMIHEEKYDESILDEAIVFMNTSRQAARIKCATIGWNGMNKILEGKD